MKIIEYEDRYLEDVKDLLIELEEYILSIDEDNLDQLHSEYRDKMAMLDLEEVKNKYGKLVEYKIVENNSRRNKADMVFTRKDGTYSGTDIIKYPFKIIHHELGIKCRFYDLRGSFATISLRNGCEIKDIAEVLGHKRVETTERYYITSGSNDKRKVIQSFDNSILLDIKTNTKI